MQEQEFLLRDRYPSSWHPTLIHHYFLQHANHAPEHKAIISEKIEWTYKELKEASHSFALQFLNQGLKKGDRVLIHLDPCPQAVAVIIACSTLGLIFVPIDPEYPQDRLHYILDSVQPSLIVFENQEDQQLISNYPNMHYLQINKEGDSAFIYTAMLPKEIDYKTVLETDIAYIIFTSGSTGNPKGIMMTHQAALAFFRGIVEFCNLTTDERIGTIAPIQFDFSLLDMGLAFGSGVTLVQIPRKFTRKPPFIAKFIETKGVTQLNCVPTIWRLLLRYAQPQIIELTKLKKTLYAGEPFSEGDLKQVHELLPHMQIINCFGHSESIACSFSYISFPLEENQTNVPFGKGHPGVELFLINEDGKEILGDNEVGELYLRGASLFSGYWKDEKSTNRSLVVNPLYPETNEKVFRSFDMAYRDKNGDYYFAGRRDFQIKILGNRVEIEEIERTLGKHPAVVEVAVLFNEEKVMLSAYVVPNDPMQPRIELEQNLREYCSSKLPSYMMPRNFYFCSQLPTTINGKVDRKLLQSNFQ